MRQAIKRQKKNPRWLSTREQKVEFLIAHRELWDADADVIRLALVEAKLVSAKTYLHDLCIKFVLEEAKKRCSSSVGTAAN